MILYGEVWRDEKAGEIRFVWVDGVEHMKVFTSDNVYEVLSELSESGWECYSVLDDPSRRMFGADKRIIYYVRWMPRKSR